MISTRGWGVRDRIAAASGLVVVGLGVMGLAFELPWPTGDRERLAEFVAAHRVRFAAQSLVFAAGAVLSIWFLAAVRARSQLSQSRAARTPAVLFAAGVVGTGIGVVGVAPQLVMTLPWQTTLSAEAIGLLADLGFVLLTLANMPFALAYAAAAVLSLRDRALCPRWLGVLALIGCIAFAGLAATLTRPVGAFAPQGWVVYVLYPLTIPWLLATAWVLTFGRSPGTRVEVSAGGRNSREPARTR